jgi:hypothetical protein
MARRRHGKGAVVPDPKYTVMHTLGECIKYLQHVLADSTAIGAERARLTLALGLLNRLGTQPPLIGRLTRKWC